MNEQRAKEPQPKEQRAKESWTMDREDFCITSSKCASGRYG